MSELNPSASPAGTSTTWIGRSSTPDGNCLVVTAVPATAVSNGLLQLSFPDGFTRSVVVADNKLTGEHVVVVADSRNPDHSALVYDRPEWDQHLADARAGKLDFDALIAANQRFVGANDSVLELVTA